MSRYAHRLAPPSNSNWYRGGGGGRGEDEDDEDDDTAVATDLSGLQQQRTRRGVSFGENEVEEFHGSEAPEAVPPARSRSRQGHRPSPSPAPPLAPPTYGGIGRPRSTSFNDAEARRRPSPLAQGEQRDEPPRRARERERYEQPYPPPPPRQDVRYGSTSSGTRHSLLPPPPPLPPQGYSYGRPTSFARGGTGGGYEDYDDDAGEGEDDDEDAFTAVGTGVATDLDLEGEPAGRGGGYDDDPRERLRYAQQQQQQQQHRPPTSGSGFLAVPRPPSRGVPVYRSSPALPPPPPPPVQRHHQDYGYARSPSGYQASDFSMDDDDPDGRSMPPPPVPSRRSGLSPSPSSLAPPGGTGRGIARPASTGSMRMLIDEEGEGGLGPGYYDQRVVGRQGTPRQRTPVQALPAPPAPPAVPEDSPVEKELIALLKELRFSIALKDFHDTTRIGVQKTLVAEDGLGHAYCKVHCKKLPRHEDIAKEAHLRQHWIPIAGSRWEFRTASHRVTVVFKTAALAAYEAQFLTGRR